MLKILIKIYVMPMKMIEKTWRMGYEQNLILMIIWDDNFF